MAIVDRLRFFYTGIVVLLPRMVVVVVLFPAVVDVFPTYISNAVHCTQGRMRRGVTHAWKTSTEIDAYM